MPKKMYKNKILNFFLDFLLFFYKYFQRIKKNKEENPKEEKFIFDNYEHKNNSICLLCDKKILKGKEIILICNHRFCNDELIKNIIERARKKATYNDCPKCHEVISEEILHIIFGNKISDLDEIIARNILFSSFEF